MSYREMAMDAGARGDEIDQMAAMIEADHRRQMEDELMEIEASFVENRGNKDYWKRKCQRLIVALAASQRENERLREFIDHKPDCKTWIHPLTFACSCGLDAALREGSE